MNLLARYQAVLDRLVPELKVHYAGDVVSCAVFGSVGRGTPREGSDIDVLIIARGLPRGRMARVEELCPVEDTRILYDEGGFFAAVLDRLRARLRQLGSRRIWRGNAWYWDLKPDFKPGEVFEL